MSDLERLDEAVEKLEAMRTPSGMYGSEHDAIVEAVRAYCNGERWLVCEEHGSRRAVGLEAICEAGLQARRLGFDHYLDCSIVSKLLVFDPTTEEGR